MLKAAAEGQTPRIIYLLSLGVDLDHSDDNGLTALHHASFSGFEDAAKALLDAGADVNASSEVCGTPLCVAALKARRNVVDLLIRYRADVLASGGWLGSVLHSACASGDAATVRFVTECGAEVDTAETVWLGKDSPFKLASAFLLDKMDLDFMKCQPLHIACLNGDLAIMKYLISVQAAVAAKTNRLSSSNGREFVSASERLRHIANPIAASGVSALMLAAACGHADAIDLLVDEGASVSAPYGQTQSSAIAYAISKGQEECVRRLINRGAALNDADFAGMTPLMHAAVKGELGCSLALMRAGAELERPDRNGRTALHLALKWGGRDVANALLEAGAEVNTVDCNKTSLLDLTMVQSQDFAHALARRGARFSIWKENNSYTLLRLLHVETLEFEVFGIFDKDIRAPEYAVLSHTWGEGEVMLEDIQRVSAFQREQLLFFLNNPKASVSQLDIRYRKLMNLCRRAKVDGINWIWMDSCCIDKDNKVELATALKSIFTWTGRAAKRYVYLDDVEIGPASQIILEVSAWFTRSWTLQDLLAGHAHDTYFFDREWKFLGTRLTLSAELSRVTGIELEHLLNYKKACMAARLSWGAHRSATRAEDVSYAMLGIVGSNMEPRYGEGGEQAFKRLQRTIIDETNDESIFAWARARARNEYTSDTSGLLAPSISCFHGCGTFTTQVADTKYKKRFLTTPEGVIEVELPPKYSKTFQRAWENTNPTIDLILRCWRTVGNNRRDAAVISLVRCQPKILGDTKAAWRRVRSHELMWKAAPIQESEITQQQGKRSVTILVDDG